MKFNLGFSLLRKQILKRLAALNLLLLFLASGFYSAYAQEHKKNTWHMSTSLAHYSRIENTNHGDLGHERFNVSPGIEVLYENAVNNKISFCTGASYQYVNLVSYNNRFKFGELTFPTLIKYSNRASFFSCSAGIYSGRLLHSSWEIYTRYSWLVIDKSKEEQYSESNFFVDAYFDVCFNLSSNKKIQPKPFVKYRVKENWINHFSSRFHYGLKFQININ